MGQLIKFKKKKLLAQEVSSAEAAAKRSCMVSEIHLGFINVLQPHYCTQRHSV